VTVPAEDVAADNGIIAPGLGRTLSGSSATASPGSLGWLRSADLAGQQITVAIGTITTSGGTGATYQRDPQPLTLLGVPSQRTVTLNKPARQIGALLKG